MVRRKKNIGREGFQLKGHSLHKPLFPTSWLRKMNGVGYLPVLINVLTGRILSIILFLQGDEALFYLSLHVAHRGDWESRNAGKETMKEHLIIGRGSYTTFSLGVPCDLFCLVFLTRQMFFQSCPLIPGLDPVALYVILLLKPIKRFDVLITNGFGTFSACLARVGKDGDGRNFQAFLRVSCDILLYQPRRANCKPQSLFHWKVMKNYAGSNSRCSLHYHLKDTSSRTRVGHSMTRIVLLNVKLR